ncbi:MAG TPA: hypothetical protein VIK22_07835 [Candidatus Anoxymicrobiaceae bacterium]
MAGKSGLPAGKGIFSPACVLLTFLLVVSACWASVLAMPGIAQAASTADAPLDNAYVPNGQVDAVVHSGGLTYMKGDNTVAQDIVTVPPNSRATVSPRTKLGTGNDAAHDFSTRVACTNGKQIIAERPMYFNYNGVWTGGHDVVGFTP